MIKYFHELENPSDQYLNLIDTNLNYVKNIMPKNVPIEFILKYKKLFNRIKELDLLYENNDKLLKLYNEDKETDFEYSLEFLYDLLCSKYIWIFSNDFGLSINGGKKFCELLANYFISDKEISFDYFCLLLDYMKRHDKDILSTNFYSINYYLNQVYNMSKEQDKLSKADIEIFQKVFDDLDKMIFQIKEKDFIPVKMSLPNAWYITPDNYLYNTMGPDGHKVARLIYSYQYDKLINNVCNPLVYLNKMKKHIKDGFIDRETFNQYTNLIYDFVSIYPEEYYDMSNIDKMRYRQMDKKNYDAKILSLIVGIESAYVGFFRFFYNLKINSINYEEDLKFIMQFDLDDVLVRCCGFHKVSSVVQKTITTSCINYEEEFRKYIEKGWKIDFVKPIIFNPYTKRVEEYSDDFIKLRSIIKNY